MAILVESSSVNYEIDTISEMREQESDILNDCVAKKIIERRTGEKNLLITSWCLEAIGSGGFLGEYYQLKITINRNGVLETFIFFAKTPPPPGPQRDFMFQNGLFNKEISMYNEVVTRMGIGSGAKWSAECYYCKPNVIIVMEDLTLDGYSVLDKYVPFGYEELACLFTTFAKFHSRSLILDVELRHQGKNLYDIWGKLLDEELVCSKESSLLIQKSGLGGALALVDMVECFDDDEKKLIKQKVTKWTLNIIDALQPSKKYRNIICHRDVWSANFMFKLDEQGNKINCRLIDFQLYSYIYPAIDLMLSMYMNSTRTIRDKYFNSLIKLYHDCLGQCLKSDANLDIDDILPWNVLLESCETARPTALVYAINHQQIILLNDDVRKQYFIQSPELLKRAIYGDGRHELICPQFFKIPLYRERLTDTIIEIYERLPDNLFNDDNNG